jgi:lysophospholipase L1-like esterase
LLNQYKKIVDFSGSSNYVIIGLHKYGNADRMKGIEEVMTKEFGARFINLRQYLSTNALSDANLTPTNEDLIAMQKGECPPQLLIDNVHFNTTGSSLIGSLVYNRMLNLGVFN